MEGSLFALHMNPHRIKAFSRDKCNIEGQQDLKGSDEKPRVHISFLFITINKAERRKQNPENRANKHLGLLVCCTHRIQSKGISHDSRPSPVVRSIQLCTVHTSCTSSIIFVTIFFHSLRILFSCPAAAQQKARHPCRPFSLPLVELEHS